MAQEDVPSIPDPGLDANRRADFGFNDAPPAHSGVPNQYPYPPPSALPGEQGTGDISTSFGDNDFPRNTGHDSLSDEEAVLS